MVDYTTLNDEILNAKNQLQVGWEDFATFCKAKMFEAAMDSGNVSSYSIGGRSVSRTLDQWQVGHTFAKKQANIETGVPLMQDISFVNRGSC